MNQHVKNILIDKINIIKETNKQDMALVGPINLPVQLEEQEVLFQWYTWLSLEGLSSDKEEILSALPSIDLASSQQSSVLVFGDFEQSENALIRFHSICHTGDIFGSKKCDCGFQLRQSMKMIVENGSGALFYIANHEGRGIGLFSKSLAYLLQQEGYDTVEANELLGFRDDARNYEEAIRVLKTLRNKPVSLITNNPNKLASLQKYDINIDSHISLWGDESEYNKRYLQTKKEKSGHIEEKVPMLNQ